MVNDYEKEPNLERSESTRSLKMIFKQAEQKDIVIGAVIYIEGNDDKLNKFTIEEVLNPNDVYGRKGFCVGDNCRYGLDGCFVIETGEDLECFKKEN